MLKAIPSNFQLKTFGSSMLPLLRNEDIVFIKKISFERIKLNDIICCKKNTQLFTHRVIYKNDKYLITKGDNNSSADGIINPPSIVGIVKKIKRKNDILPLETLYLLQSTLYFQEITTITNILNKSNISFVILKGLPLHLFYDGALPKRIYADCDILINKSDFGKVAQLLKKLKYYKMDSPLSKAHEETQKDEPEVSFGKFISGFPVVFDIHQEAAFMMTHIGNINSFYPQKLTNSFTHKLITEKRFISLQGTSFPILSPENLFIYLCLHVFHHNYKGGFRYDLIKNVLQKKENDFSKTLEIIQDYRLEKFISPCLFILKKYYNVSIPKEFKTYMTLNKTRTYIKNKLTLSYIFNDSSPVNSKIDRFMFLVLLSPTPFYKKSLVFVNPRVLISIIKTLQRTILARIKV